jgi:ribonuclease HI
MKLIVYFDGARKTSTGEAGCGASVCDAAGREVASASVFLGILARPGTHHEAEYSGLLAGLHLAGLLDVTELEVRGDSRTVVAQLSGDTYPDQPRQWRVNERLSELNEAARSLARWPTKFMWIEREENRRADQLANAAIEKWRAG